MSIAAIIVIWLGVYSVLQMAYMAETDDGKAMAKAALLAIAALVGMVVITTQIPA